MHEVMRRATVYFAASLRNLSVYRSWKSPLAALGILYKRVAAAACQMPVKAPLRLTCIEIYLFLLLHERK